MNLPACFCCENGQLYPGKYGRYCPNCDTYLPTGAADELAAAYFLEVEEGRGEEVKAGEMLAMLNDMSTQTKLGVKRSLAKQVKK